MRKLFLSSLVPLPGSAYFYVPVQVIFSMLHVPLDPILESSLLSICLFFINCEDCWELVVSSLFPREQIS